MHDSLVDGNCVSKVLLLQPFADTALHGFGDRLICDRAHNWSPIEVLATPWSAGHLILSAAFGLSTVFYAGIHSLADEALFPVERERNWWIHSCAVLFFVTILFPVAANIVDGQYRSKFKTGADFYSYRQKAVRKWMSVYQVWAMCKPVWRIVSVPGVVIFVVLYISSRGFIIVESFISLRYVPLGVYQTPNITYAGFVPHIS